MQFYPTATMYGWRTKHSLYLPCATTVATCEVLPIVKERFSSFLFSSRIFCFKIVFNTRLIIVIVANRYHIM